MTVDDQESATVTAVGDGTTLDVEGKLYLGGLPSEYKAKNIGNVSSVFWKGSILLLGHWVYLIEEMFFFLCYLIVTELQDVNLSNIP